MSQHDRFNGATVLCPTSSRNRSLVSPDFLYRISFLDAGRLLRDLPSGSWDGNLRGDPKPASVRCARAPKLGYFLCPAYPTQAD